MHLGDRRRRDGLVLEMLEHLRDRALELGLDGRAGCRTVEGGQRVLQARQVAGDGFADEIGAGAQHLAELDEAGPEILQRAREALAGAQLAGIRYRAESRQDPGGENEAAGGRQPVRGEQRVVARQRARDSDQAEQVPECPQHVDPQTRRAL